VLGLALAGCRATSAPAPEASRDAPASAERDAVAEASAPGIVEVVLEAAPRLEFPAGPDGHLPDSNGPAIWLGGERYVFHSFGWDPMLLEWPFRYRGDDPAAAERVAIPGFLDMRGCEDLGSDGRPKCSIWLEATWQPSDAPGTVYGFYHHEQKRRCGPADLPVIQRIGLLRSTDGGKSWTDLGILLEAAEADWRRPGGSGCNGTNPFVGGGNGDFSVVADPTEELLYLVFTQASGSSQGIGMARIARRDLDRPRLAGVDQSHAAKWNGAWVPDSGIGGPVTAVLQAPPGFTFRPFTDPRGENALWGPSVHYDVAVGRYIVLLNHSICAQDDPSSCNYDPEGIWYSWTDDLASAQWAPPRELLDLQALRASFGDDKYWYPQVLGVGPGETDSLAGQGARLFVHGISVWTLRVAAR
jgi:hypothetical protein